MAGVLTLLLLGCPPPGDTSATPAPSLPEGVTATFTCDGAAADYSESEPAHAEATVEWGLSEVRGVVYIAPDLDGDGYADLVASESPTDARDDIDGGVYYHRVMMNREQEGRRVFVDATVESGLITNQDGTTGTAHDWYVAGDVDNDGDLDVYAGRYQDQSESDNTGDRNALYENDGTGHFTMATQSGLEMEDAYPSAGGAFADVDGDGNVDLWLVGWYKDYGGSYDSAQPQLYLGHGDGTFTNVTEDSGLELKSSAQTDNYLERGRRRPGFGATACDVTGDGLAELIQSSYGRAWNLIWTHDGNDWVEYGEAAGVDMDDNGDYTDNLWYACYCDTHSCDPAPSVSCGGAFPDDYWTPGFDDQAARLGGNTFTTMCGDIDNDGDLDLMHTEIAHMWAGQSSDPSELLVNDGTGMFARLDRETSGIARDRPTRRDWNEGDLYGAFWDYDNDGWKDVLIVTTDYEDTQLYAFRNLGGNLFEDVSTPAGLDQEWPNGAAIADFDRDGDLDVVTGSSNARSGSPWSEHYAHFHENRLGGSSLRIEGAAIGTRVEVDAAGITQTFEVSGGYGHWGMFHDQALHVGLDGECAVDAIRFTPAGGETTTVGPISGS